LDLRVIFPFYAHIISHTTTMTTLSVPNTERIVNVYTSAADTRWLTPSPSLSTLSPGHFYDPTTPSQTYQPSRRIMYYYVPALWVCQFIYVGTYHICARNEVIHWSAGWAGNETCRQENPQNSRLTIKYVIARDVVVEPPYLCVYFYCSYYIIYIIYIYLCAITAGVYLFSSLNI